MNKPTEKKPKKLHVKHIDVGFMYAETRDTTNLKMVVEIMNDPRHCVVYLVTKMVYVKNIVRQGIVEGVRKGSFVVMTGDEYR